MRTQHVSILALAALLAACADTPADPGRIPALMSAGAEPRRALSSTGIEIVDLVGPDAWASGINDRDEIVGATAAKGAFVWRNGVATTLDNLGWPFAKAIAINERGMIAGQVESGKYSRAVVWVDGVGKFIGSGGDPGEVIDPLPMEKELFEKFIIGAQTVRDMNDAGWVVGAADIKIRSPMLWADGKEIALPLLPGAIFGDAFGINNSGWIVGLSVGDGPRATLWRGAGSEVIDLGPVDRIGGINADGIIVGAVKDRAFKLVDGAFVLLESPDRSDATAINDRGEVVGSIADADGNLTAAYWSAEGKLTVLGRLPGGTWSEAARINVNGWIVGWSTDAEGVGRAVLWKIPRTVAEVVDIIEDQIEDLPLSAAAETMLGNLLENVARAQARGGAVAPLVEAFIRQVENLVRRGELSASDGELLIKRARDILAIP